MSRIESIVKQLQDASNSYYNNSQSIITDEEFDSLKDMLKSLDSNHPFLSQIGSSPIDESHWVKAKHKIPMGSLNKVNSEDEFIKWNRSCASSNIAMSLKLDGASLDLEYERGKLVRAITRGDGIEGEDITRNVLKMKSVLSVLPNAHASLDVKYNISLRGEIILKQKDFEIINEICLENNEQPFKTMRNAASGIARSLDGKYCKYLSVIYYDTTFACETVTDRFSFIERLGLPTALIKSNVLVNDCIGIYNDYENVKRAKLDMEIDGIVCEVEDLNLKNSFGQIYGNDMGAIAWKFAPMKVKTEIVDIEWQLGNSAHITPVAIVKPVLCGGVTISKATLHNVDIFKSFYVCPGDTVLISRKNDVIPYFEAVVSSNRLSKPFMVPVCCPECGGSTKIEGKFLICTNDACKGKVSGNINVWCRKIDLKGIADATIETLCAKEIVSEPADLYSLTFKHLKDFAGFGSKQSENIFNIINSKKELTLPEFIGGLNIGGWGSRMTELLVNDGWDTLDLIMSLQEHELIQIKGIESKTANAFIDGIQSKKKIIENLLKAGITIKEKIMTKKSSGGKLTGQKFVFTGKIDAIDENGDRYTRKRLEQLVCDNGGSCEDSITSSVTGLVQADPSSQSSKTVKAKKLGIAIISEKDFFDMIK